MRLVHRRDPQYRKYIKDKAEQEKDNVWKQQREILAQAIQGEFDEGIKAAQQAAQQAAHRAVRSTQTGTTLLAFPLVPPGTSEGLPPQQLSRINRRATKDSKLRLKQRPHLEMSK